jgi:hypothetical protein
MPRIHLNGPERCVGDVGQSHATPSRLRIGAHPISRIGIHLRRVKDGDTVTGGFDIVDLF